jgi:hypothetical protein
MSFSYKLPELGIEQKYFMWSANIANAFSYLKSRAIQPAISRNFLSARIMERPRMRSIGLLPASPPLQPESSRHSGETTTPVNNPLTAGSTRHTQNQPAANDHSAFQECMVFPSHVPPQYFCSIRRHRLVRRRRT